MFNTTLCYLEQDGNYLMLHRIKKEHDINHDRWIGVGGKFEEGESPEECALREVREETGLVMNSWNYRGIVTFVSDRYEAESMHLFTSSDFSGELIDCDEGVLEWVPIAKISSLPLWTGDLIFFQGTYDTSGASHVGIYVGNNMMIHCGNPIQYASIDTSYWRAHFYCFGRLP